MHRCREIEVSTCFLVMRGALSMHASQKWERLNKLYNQGTNPDRLNQLVDQGLIAEIMGKDIRDGRWTNWQKLIESPLYQYRSLLRESSPKYKALIEFQHKELLVQEQVCQTSPEIVKMEDCYRAWCCFRNGASHDCNRANRFVCVASALFMSTAWSHGCPVPASPYAVRRRYPGVEYSFSRDCVAELRDRAIDA